MGDYNPDTPDQEGGQLPVTAPVGQAQGSEDTVYLTRKEAQQMIDEAVNRVQRSADKGITTVSKKVRQELDNIKRYMTLTPEQEKIVKDRMMEEAIFGEPDTGDATQPPASGGASPGQAQDAISLAAMEIMQEIGAVLYDGDPELEQIDRTSRAAFLRSIEEAAKAKKARLANAPVVPARLPTNAAGGGSPPPKATVEDYKNEARANRGKGHRVMEQLKEKYRKLGVDVDHVSLWR